MSKSSCVVVVMGSLVLACGDPSPLLSVSPTDQEATQLLFSSPEILELSNPNPDETDAFGFAVDLDQGRVLVGDPGNSEGRGEAYLFDGQTGQLLTSFTNPDPTPGDNFGFSVALLGDQVLIGVPNDDSAGEFQGGSAYLFSTTGSLIATLQKTAPEVNDRYGFSVALSSEYGVIGVPFERSQQFGVITGAAYVYDLDNTAVPFRILTNPAEGNDDRFGWSLGLDPTRVLVGSPFADIGSDPNQGAAYLYTVSDLEASDDTSVPALQLVSSEPQIGNSDSFGFSVSMSSNQMAIGTLNAKQVFLSDAAGNDIGQISRSFLVSSNLQLFGFSLALREDQVLVGAPGNFLRGSVLRYSADSLARLGRFRSPSQGTLNLFGFSVDHEDDLTVIGEPGRSAALLIAEASGVDLPEGIDFSQVGKVFVFQE